MKRLPWDNITKPSLLLNKQIAMDNIKSMVEKALRNQVVLRPHFKTHQSVAVGEWFKDFGLDKIAVSSLEMAEYFQKNGWKDITVAFPINLREINLINSLASKCELGVLVSGKGVSEALSKKLAHSVHVWIEIDTGYGRSGISDHALATILDEIKQIEAAELMQFKGLLVHNGQSYKCIGETEILAVHQQSLERLVILRDKIEAEGIKDFEISLGDTPCCSVAEEFGVVDEIRPGNFVFYDLTQVNIGSCEKEDIAVALACPVVAIYPERNEMIVHGGGVHLSKDILKRDGQAASYRAVVLPTQNGWEIVSENAYVKSISQEHGILTLPDEIIAKFSIGDIVGILPVHSCMTADLMRGYHLLSDSTPSIWLPMMKSEAEKG